MRLMQLKKLKLIQEVSNIGRPVLIKLIELKNLRQKVNMDSESLRLMRNQKDKFF